jgi:hypothetical protein
MAASIEHDLAGAGSSAEPDLLNRKLPPVASLSVASMALVIIGGIYLASYLPKRAPLAPAYGLLAAAAVVLAVAVALLGSIKSFAWKRFFSVLKWTFLGYVVEAGMLEYVFVYDKVRGTMLVILTLMLLIFAVSIPLLLGFSVARYQLPDSPSEG